MKLRKIYVVSYIKRGKELFNEKVTDNNKARSKE